MILNAFFYGAIAVACVVIAVIFVRFWRKTGDRFFLIFSSAFLVEGCGRLVLGVLSPASEYEPVVLSVRLFAFLIIIYAILDKNLRMGRFRSTRHPQDDK